MRDNPKDMRELLTAESIAAYRKHVIEECAQAVAYLQNTDEREALAAYQKAIAAIRALKDKP